jgi:MarR family transcriptional regulator, organic hydroperoxide resistance regulator
MKARPNTRAPADARPDLPAVLQFMQLLWRLVNGLERRSKRMARVLGVTAAQRLVIRVVGLSPGISPGALAAVLHVHPSTLTGVLRRLVAQRLLIRTSDRADRRRSALRLTARGERVNRARRGTVEAAIGRTLQGIAARDRVATQRVLERLTNGLVDR